MERVAGIVLAGGRSSRMGRPKAELPWHGLPLVVRVAGILRRSLPGPYVVVRAPGQPLPSLPAYVEVIEDEREGRGPLEGIAAGLRALRARAEAAYVSSTDAPLLHPSFVQLVAGALVDGVDVAVPRAHDRLHPLAAAYRTALLPLVDALRAADRLRPAFLFDEVKTRYLEEDVLRKADPELRSLWNLNTPDDYAHAAALPPPLVRVERFGTLREVGAASSDLVRAASLGSLAATIKVELDSHVVAALNGDQISRDPRLPLVEGDVVALMSADAGG